MPRRGENAVTTRHPEYIAARLRLAVDGYQPDVKDVQLLFGVQQTAAQNWGRAGKYGGQMVDGRYVFDRDAIRREIGLLREEEA